MTRLPGQQRRLRWIDLLLFVACLLVNGCRDVIGPEQMATTTVSGRVHVSGKPFTQGWIEFMPVDGTVGRLRSAAIGPDGSFSAQKVAVGTVGIHLAGPRPPSSGDDLTDRYLMQLRRGYPSRVQIKSDRNPPLDLDLHRMANEELEREKRMIATAKGQER